MGKYDNFRNYFKSFLILLGCVLTTAAVSAQNTVKGTVLDSEGQVLPGVNVLEKGTSNGVVTDFDGNYKIDVSIGKKLIFSYIGFVSQEIRVDDSSNINVTLAENIGTLDKVVVLGYATKSRTNITQSVSNIASEDIANIPQVSVDQLIQGRASGVTVTNNTGQPGGSVSIKIRGVGSINASAEPLYIIDGVPFSGDARNISASGQSFLNSASPLAALNPNDIESINILKDASATAIYGSRGANGVVIITTKKGKAGKGTISYNGYTSIQRPINKLPVLNLREYAAFQNELRNVFNQDAIEEFARPELLGEGTDWQSQIFQDAFLMNHQLSFSGGNENSKYYLSTGYTEQEGTVIGSQFDRISIKANLDSKINNYLKVGMSLTASRTDENIINNGNSRGIVALALRNNPAIAVFNPDGSFAGPTTAEEIALAITNPIAQIESVDNDLIRNRLFGNLYGEFKIANGLKYRTEFGGSFEFLRNTIFQRAFSFGLIEVRDINLTERREENQFWQLKNIISYDKSFGDHSLTMLAGHESQENSWNGLQAFGNGFVDDLVPTFNNSNSDNDINTQYKGSTALESFFGQLFYSYDDRYSLTASLRADGSSNFTRDNRWGYFPSISAAWRISNESFMSNFKAIKNIKLFGGYGEVGNQAIPPFSFGSRLRPSATDLGNAFAIANFPNPDLKWETSKATNLGLEFSLFDESFTTTIEVYRKINSDFLFQLGLTDFVIGGINQPGSVAPPWVNLGEMENKGIDVTLTYDKQFSDNFSWNSSFTLSHYKNEVLELVDGLKINGQADLDDTVEVLTLTEVGEAIGVFFGYQVEGLFRTIDDLNNAPIQFGQPVGDASVPGRTWLGDIKYRDVNGDGIVDGNDRTRIGSPHPDFTFGWQNNFSYKNFNLGIFLQGSYGNEVFNAINRSLTGSNLTFRNQLTSVVDYYTIDNPDATHPRYTQNATTNIFISDRYIEDGSYLRIQNVKLGYSLPSKLLGDIGFSKVGIYGSIQNLYTFTNYSGYDPEIGSFNQNQLLQGVDNGRYPSPRTFTVGVDLEF